MKYINSQCGTSKRSFFFRVRHADRIGDKLGNLPAHCATTHSSSFMSMSRYPMKSTIGVSSGISPPFDLRNTPNRLNCWILEKKDAVVSSPCTSKALLNWVGVFPAMAMSPLCRFALAFTIDSAIAFPKAAVPLFASSAAFSCGESQPDLSFCSARAAWVTQGNFSCEHGNELGMFW